ncbi:trypsin-like serine protease [Ruficoccus amylovorans]|uniref:Trypsin-like serine protease n=1 Tax=Ruficoccus amylovorans TaxID=1804625 RepID=A0A842HJ19_9BACT|nr:trypsin-like peptidase domain-containing protein [Ruficoccus amylovorans]MBC2595604.1 trypsin-like serine protease [Ruficoccus amylovorans]
MRQIKANMLYRPEIATGHVDPPAKTATKGLPAGDSTVYPCVMFRRSLILTLSLVLTPLFCPALVNSGNPGGNRTAPTGQDGQPTDPGFANMLVIRGGAGVYLGNGWVLTARHITPGMIILNGEKRMREEIIGKMYKFKNAELMLIRLKETPDLPTVKIASSTPAVGTEVVMIGAGRRSQDHLTFWQVSQASNPWTWTEVTDPQQANMAGVVTDPGGLMSWGTNRISAVNPASAMGELLVTDFSANPAERTAFEAQAVSQDSGGALFAQDEKGEWVLTGIMATVGRLYPGQPGVGKPEGSSSFIIGSGVFGNLTLSVNLAPYREEILRVTGLSGE